MVGYCDDWDSQNHLSDSSYEMRLVTWENCCLCQDNSPGEDKIKTPQDLLTFLPTTTHKHICTLPLTQRAHHPPQAGCRGRHFVDFEVKAAESSLLKLLPRLKAQHIILSENTQVIKCCSMDPKKRRCFGTHIKSCSTKRFSTCLHGYKAPSNACFTF